MRWSTTRWSEQLSCGAHMSTASCVLSSDTSTCAVSCRYSGRSFAHSADTNPAYNADGQYSAPIILYSFLIGINMGFTLGSAIEAGVSTIFVGLGEDPM